KYKKINKNLVGFMRATEVTVNNIDNSDNQDMHVFVCVESTCFYNTENYVNQNQWIQFCIRAMKLDYDPNVKVQMIRIRNKHRYYKQHMNVLVCIEITYFYNTEKYVNQKKWIQFWKRAMKLDYDPKVKVQMIRPKNKHKSDIKSAIDETAKYPVKDTDFMTDDEERNLQRLADLEEGLYRK